MREGTRTLAEIRPRVLHRLRRKVWRQRTSPVRQRLSTMPKTLRALLVILLAVLLLGGCSLRFAYGKLDWLVPWYVRDFVTLNAGQRSDLDRRLAVQLTWHCRTQLADYAAGLRDAQTLFSSDRVERGAARGLPPAWRGLVAGGAWRADAGRRRPACRPFSRPG